MTPGRKKEINELVEDVKSNKVKNSKKFYYKKILERLEGSDHLPEEVVDEEFIRNCFSYQLNGVLKHLLEKAPANYEELFREQREEIPYIFQTNCEQVALILIKRFEPETWKHPFRNQLNENILHHFITQGFQHAVSYLLDNH